MWLIINTVAPVTMPSLLHQSSHVIFVILSLLHLHHCPWSAMFCSLMLSLMLLLCHCTVDQCSSLMPSLSLSHVAVLLTIVCHQCHHCHFASCATHTMIIATSLLCTPLPSTDVGAKKQHHSQGLPSSFALLSSYGSKLSGSFLDALLYPHGVQIPTCMTASCAIIDNICAMMLPLEL